MSRGLMLTIFSIPKSFESPVADAQRNAIQSWSHLLPACEVILCGNDPGVAEIAAELELHHISDVTVNEYGTPLLNDAFERVERLATFELICYVNADIILMSDFMLAVQQIPMTPFLMIGRRWNVDDVSKIDFEKEDWELDLREFVARFGSLQPPAGSDLFVYPSGSLGTLPEFAVGRPGWDNWMIYNARKRRMPVIDATNAGVVVHQNHDYGHVKQRYDDTTYSGPEADHNLTVMGGNRTRFTITDATHTLNRGKLVRVNSPAHWRRRVTTLAALYPQLRPVADVVRKVWPRK
jgi:hypothetical protein